MAAPFIEFFKLINICTSDNHISDPIIAIQPRMNLKSLSVNYDMCNGPVGNIPDMTWKTRSPEGKFIVELKFSVDYRNFPSYYTLIKKDVFLKRYKKKQTPDERYDDSIHSPTNLVLPGGNGHLTLFKLDISAPEENGVASSHIVHPTDVISFHSSLQQPATTVEDIRNLNRIFLSYMVDNIEELSSVAFQFFVEITSEAANEERIIKTVTSDFFGFNFNDDLSFITECKLNPDDFHVSVALKDINQGRLSRFRGFFRERKGKKTDKEETRKNRCVIS